MLRVAMSVVHSINGFAKRTQTQTHVDEVKSLYVEWMLLYGISQINVYKLQLTM